MKYFKQILHYIKNFIVTLKFSILIIFISLFSIASILLITINYFNTSKYILFIENKSMQDITNFLNHVLFAEFNQAERDVKITHALITNSLLDVNDSAKMMNYFNTLATQFEIIQAIYWAGINGNYISAEYENDDSITNYFINRDVENPTQLHIQHDVSGKVIKYNQSNASYDPRNRPWFLKAELAKKSIWTPIYLYQPEKYLGITLATPIYDLKKNLKGILGIDIRLDWLSWYINTLKVSPNGMLFIVQRDGKIIAYPHFDHLKDQTQLVSIKNVPAPWINYSFEIYIKNQTPSFSFDYQNKRYLATYSSLTKLNGNAWLIGIVVPETDFISEIATIRMTNILVSLLILLIGILLVSILVNRIVNPVKLLIKETDRIKNFDLEDKGMIHSRIKEILLLAHAINVMRIGLQAFKRYVPAALVKQLIKKGINAHLGGNKKKVVVFFSDIKDFTTIMHLSNPNTLMLQLNEYFEALTNIIIYEKGTIDKYIGDSIMAFWGAPDEIDFPCHHAANAAIKIMNTIYRLNSKWHAEGKFPFFTRIGMHIGDAIVGNVGSTERINYTVIGDTINIASRLEEINKKYNTTILVSKEVYELIKHDFSFSEIGEVKLKGLEETICIYSLLDHLHNKVESNTSLIERSDFS